MVSDFLVSTDQCSSLLNLQMYISMPVFDMGSENINSEYIATNFAQWVILISSINSCVIFVHRSSHRPNLLIRVSKTNLLRVDFGLLEEELRNKHDSQNIVIYSTLFTVGLCLLCLSVPFKRISPSYLKEGHCNTL